jgi:hypothetical protein
LKALSKFPLHFILLVDANKQYILNVCLAVKFNKVLDICHNYFCITLILHPHFPWKLRGFQKYIFDPQNLQHHSKKITATSEPIDVAQLSLAVIVN